MSYSITTLGGVNSATVSNNVLGDALANFSMSFWIKSTSTQNTSIFLAQKESGGNNAGWFIFVIPNTGQLSFGVDAGGFQKNATTNFYDGNWHNLIVAYDAAVGVTGYLDGVALTFGAGAGTTPLTNNQPMSFGPGGSSLNGQFFDMRFYNITLSALQSSIISKGGGIGTTNLQAEWPFVESSGTTLSDSTGNGNTITYNISPTPFSNTDIPAPFLSGVKPATMFLVF